MQNHSTGIRNLNSKAYMAIKISFPPLPEQQRIVRILDEAFAAIAVARANAEKNLRNARELFESYLNAVFTRRGEGWVERTLKALATIMYGYTESATDRRIGPKFLRITDIQNNVVNWENVPYCKISNEDKPKYLLNGGDIVFARTGATTGKSYLVKDPPEAVFASYLIRVQIDNNELLPDFLYLFFQSSNYWDSIQTGISGSAQGGFNATKLGELRIPYPISTNEQKNLVSDLSEINIVTNNLGLIHQQKINFLDELKQSLLHHAFTGQL
jgi:type I restriction enzyme S subunit